MKTFILIFTHKLDLNYPKLPREVHKLDKARNNKKHSAYVRRNEKIWTKLKMKNKIKY
jgi:hypothetical protein